MSANQDYSGDEDSLCYSASTTDENDFSLDFSDAYFETLVDSKKVVVIFGDGFHPRQQQQQLQQQQQQHDVKSQKQHSSKPFGRQVHNSRPSPSNKMQYKQGQSFHPNPSGHITFHAPMQAAISLK